jgi:glycosyltransferase involved in cell wall biosynthesis
MPKLSIITINLNNQEGLGKTIKSVVEQTYSDFEYIVIDGGSIDGSIDVIHQYESKITKWISEKDAGIYNAMNKGLYYAKGTYCLFLNSGDYLVNSDVIAKVFGREYSQDILYGELIFDFGAGHKEIAKLPEKLDLVHLYNDNIWHPATFIKTALLTAIGGYNEKYRIADDYDFFFNMIAINRVNCIYLPYPISVYDTKGISSLSGNMPQILSERASIHQIYLDKEEIIFLNNLRKYQNPALAKWLVNKPIPTRIVDLLQRLHRKLS